MAASYSIAPLEDLVPLDGALTWNAGTPLDELTQRVGDNGQVEYARYLKVVSVGGSPSLVLNLLCGETRTYNATTALMAAGWETSRGLQIASIDATTADITAVLVGY